MPQDKKFEDLPDELQDRIIAKLPYKSLVNVGAVNKHLHAKQAPEERRRRGKYAKFFRSSLLPWGKLSKHLEANELHRLASLAEQCNRHPSRSMLQEQNRNTFRKTEQTHAGGRSTECIDIISPLRFKPTPDEDTKRAAVLQTKKQELGMHYGASHQTFERHYSNEPWHVCPHVPPGAVLVNPNTAGCSICTRNMQAATRRGVLDKAYRKLSDAREQWLQSANAADENVAQHLPELPFDDPGSDDELAPQYLRRSRFRGMITPGKPKYASVRLSKPAAPQLFFAAHGQQAEGPIAWGDRAAWDNMAFGAFCGGRHEEAVTAYNDRRTVQGNNVSRRMRAAGNPESAAALTLQQGADLLEKELGKQPIATTRKRYKRDTVANMASSGRHRRCCARTAAGPCRAWAMHGCQLCRAHRR